MEKIAWLGILHPDVIATLEKNGICAIPIETKEGAFIWNPSVCYNDYVYSKTEFIRRKIKELGLSHFSIGTSYKGANVSFLFNGQFENIYQNHTNFSRYRGVILHQEGCEPVYLPHPEESNEYLAS